MRALVPKFKRQLPAARTASRCSRTSARSWSAPSRCTTCPACGGARLNDAARAVAGSTGSNIAECSAMQVSDLAAFVPRHRPTPRSAPMLDALRQTPGHLVEHRPRLPQPGPGDGDAVRRRVPAGQDGAPPRLQPDRRHLRLRRAQRSGLHPHDIQRLNDLLLRLRDKGNTVLVVEHKPEVDRDRRPHRRPGARRRAAGGRGRATTATSRGCGTPARSPDATSTRAAAARRRPASPTGTSDRERDPAQPAATSAWRSRSASSRVVTGVAGSGKSSLIHGSLPGRDGVVVVDQIADPRVAAQQPGHLHRAARPDPEGVREGEQGQARAVQRQLRRAPARTARARRHLHGSRA